MCVGELDAVGVSAMAATYLYAFTQRSRVVAVNDDFDVAKR
jgi:hypothetical protein